MLDAPWILKEGAENITATNTKFRLYQHRAAEKFSFTATNHVEQQIFPQSEINKNKCISCPRWAMCTQSSVLSFHILLQSPLRNAPALTFPSSLTVHLQPAAGSVPHHVAVRSLQRKLLSKGVRVLLAASLTARTLHSTAEYLQQKKKNRPFPLLLPSHLVLFPSYRENRNVREKLDWYSHASGSLICFPRQPWPSSGRSYASVIATCTAEGSAEDRQESQGSALKAWLSHTTGIWLAVGCNKYRLSRYKRDAVQGTGSDMCYGVFYIQSSRLSVIRKWKEV